MSTIEQLLIDSANKASQAADGFENAITFDDQSDVTLANLQTVPSFAKRIRQKIEELAALGQLNGASAYEIAVEYGFVGTEQDWLDSLGVTEAEIEQLILNVLQDFTIDGGYLP